VEGLLRRHPPPPREATPDDTEPYDDGVLRVDPVQHQVTVHGAPVHLTPTEFRLLHALVRRPGAVLRRSELLAQAWDDPTGIAPSRVKFAVLRLRRKLGWGDPKTSPLESLRSVGYRYRPPE
jgi:DNA-binding response OmpR family regulator